MAHPTPAQMAAELTREAERWSALAATHPDPDWCHQQAATLAESARLWAELATPATR